VKNQWGRLIAELRRLAAKRGYVTHLDVCKLSGVDATRAGGMMSDYVRRGLMRRVDGGRYVPVDKSKTLREVVLDLVASGRTITARDVAQSRGCGLVTARSKLGVMERDGTIRRVSYGRYARVEATEWQTFSARRRELFTECVSPEEYETRLSDLTREMGMQTPGRS
jgi:predicted transcriptional regulator of viral defense system